MSTIYVTGLSIARHQRSARRVDIVPVGPSEIEYSCIAATVALALDLLECRPSLRVLSRYTREIADDTPEIPRLRTLKHGAEIDVVKEFLAAIRRCTPPILITRENSMCTKNGRTNKLDCPDVFDPKRAAAIELNEVLIARLAWASQRARPNSPELGRFQTLLLRISITFAHELVHVYTLFLRRQRGRHTPPTLTYGGYGSTQVGEAGRLWEYRLFGGFVDMRDRQGEAIALRDSGSQYAWRMRLAVVQRLVERRFSWLDETLTSSDHDNYRDAVERLPALRWKQRWEDIFPPPVQGEPINLPEAQLQMLVNLASHPQFPVCRISVNDLLRFSQDPATQIRIEVTRTR